MAVDLVCGKTVEGTHWIRAGVVRWVFEGDPYFFCSLTCRRTFTADPTRFLTAAVPSSGRLPIVPSPISSARLSVVPADPPSGERPVVERDSSARLTVVPPPGPDSINAEKAEAREGEREETSDE